MPLTQIERNIKIGRILGTRGVVSLADTTFQRIPKEGTLDVRHQLAEAHVEPETPAEGETQTGGGARRNILAVHRGELASVEGIRIQARDLAGELSHRDHSVEIGRDLQLLRVGAETRQQHGCCNA